MTDLFDYRDRYPHAPGFKRDGTSKDAAGAVKDAAPTLRGLCLEAIKNRPRTADEVARRLNRSVLSVRPRVSELHELGLIEETGERRANASGHKAAVWRVKQ
jgi:predicted transcriptional regulator